MIYAQSSSLADLAHVVMDEVHYLADRSRGAVWEEVLIHLPDSVTVTALSATVRNAEEFGHWLGTVRGPTDVIVEEYRPVPLWQHVLVSQHLHDLFVDDARRRVNPELLHPGRTKPAWNGCSAGRGVAGLPAAASDRATTTGSLVPRWYAGSTRRTCCRPSRSSSAGRAVMLPWTSACKREFVSPASRNASRSTVCRTGLRPRRSPRPLSPGFRQLARCAGARGGGAPRRDGAHVQRGRRDLASARTRSHGVCH